MADLFDTRNGYTPSKNKKEYWTGGSIPWFRMEDLRTNGQVLNQALQTVTKAAVKGNVFPKDTILVSTTATIGEHALITVPALANQRFTALMLKPEYQGVTDMKYLFYHCFLLDEYCKDHLNEGNFASVDMRKFDQYCFTIPPLDKQKEIVHILDQFDSLCNGMISGLPAEIKKRKEQYEYYRNNLFSYFETSQP